MSTIHHLRDYDIASALHATQVKPPEGSPPLRGFVCPPTLKEINLFVLLKWKFGPPNGFITFLGRPEGDPDGPFKWDYILRPYEGLHLQIIRTVNGIECWWWGDSQERSDILLYIENNLILHAKEIEKGIGELEEYTLILNPFVERSRYAAEIR